MLKKTALLVMVLSLFSIVLVAQKMDNYNINLKSIPDGTYLGKTYAKYPTGDIYLEANVTVKAGKLTEIKLTKKPENKPAKPAEIAFDKMIRRNTIDVDAKTAATWKNIVFDALKNQNKVK